jgi:dipeptidyl aminopeptidase/acylaminoacyl peptidase
MIRPLSLPAFFLATFAMVPLAAGAARPLTPEDWYRFEQLSGLQLAPDGQSAAYLVTRYDKESDEARTALWQVGWAGGDARALTSGESVGNPRYSPDGRYLSYTSARPPESPSQLWLLDRRGGEPRAASRLKGELNGYEWLPDSRHLVIVLHTDATTDAPPPVNADGSKAEKRPVPIVVDALAFKSDDDGYRKGDGRTQLALLDAMTSETVPLTSDAACEASEPAVSGDGQHIAYVCHRYDSMAVLARDEIRVIEAKAGATPRTLVTVDSPNGQHLAWSPDGRQIALLLGDEPTWTAYQQDRLALVDVGSGALRIVTGSLDRAVGSPHFAADGRSMLLTVEDDRLRYLARVDLTSGAVTPVGTRRVVEEIALANGPGGERIAVLSSADFAADNVHAVEGNGAGATLRKLTTHDDALFGELALGTIEDIRFKSRDGTEVHGMLHKPPGYAAGKRYPLVLWIHGGPNGQDEHGITLAASTPGMVRRLLASHGYLVLAVNYRGSSGRGQAFARAIHGDWGNKEVQDLRAGVDHVLALGLADPKRLGIGGWSYGGILTDYTIASDGRFAVAASGAGSANQLSMYGMDQYIMQYQAELGAPWKNLPLWEKLSYPFFHADRVHTPTLFMGGDKDFNVPIAGGEQMYQALRVQGVPAQLVVYPGEHHSFKRPSFLADRWRRYIDWLGRYLQ